MSDIGNIKQKILKLYNREEIKDAFEAHEQLGAEAMLYDSLCMAMILKPTQNNFVKVKQAVSEIIKGE